MNKIEELMTLDDFKKIYSFYDNHGRRSVLVEDILRYIDLEMASAVEEQKEKDAEIVKSYFKKDNALMRAMCIEILEQ